MEDNKKKKTIKRCVLIILLLFVTLFQATNTHCKREISSWMNGFYGMESFAFKEKKNSNELSPMYGVWHLSDLAQYRETADKNMNPSERDNYMAYFKNADNTLRWDNISEWLNNDASEPSYVEYDVFAEIMLDMTDDELEKVIELGQIKCSGFSKYRLSDILKNVASVYVIKTSDERRKVFPIYDFRSEEFIRFDDAETRALGFLQTVIEIDNLKGKYVSVEISSEEYQPPIITCKCFTYKVIPKGTDILGLYSPVIMAYPRQTGLGLEETFKDIFVYDYKALANIKTSIRLPKEQLKQAMSFMLDIGYDNQCMEISGQIVQVTRENCVIAYIADIEYDETELKIRSSAYDIVKGQNMTVEQLKEHFVNRDDDFQMYYAWYLRQHSKQLETYKYAVRFSLANQGISSLEDATDSQLNKAMQLVSEAIKETDTYELGEGDGVVIKNWIQENGT